MTDHPCRITDSWIQEPADIPYCSPEESDWYINGGPQDELDNRPYSDEQMAEALDEIYEGEWRERFPDAATAFDILGSDKLRRAANLIAARDVRESANRELRGALEDIARMSEIPLLKKQAS